MACLCSDSIARPNHLKRLVKFNTRDSGILDWFFTNRPHTSNLQRLPKLGASDHYTVLASSTVKHPPQHDTVKKVYRRHCRASNWREFGSLLTTKDWSEVYQTVSCICKFEFFSQELNSAIETFFPWKTVKTHVYDKPWITVKLNYMIKKRQAAFIRYGKDSLVFRMWWNRVQGAIETAKRSYYDNKVDGLAETNPKKWWQDIKSLTGQDTFSKQEWHYQFLNDIINSPALLAAQINDFFH